MFLDKQLNLDRMYAEGQWVFSDTGIIIGEDSWLEFEVMGYDIFFITFLNLNNVSYYLFFLENLDLTQIMVNCILLVHFFIIARITIIKKRHRVFLWKSKEKKRHPLRRTKTHILITFIKIII